MQDEDSNQKKMQDEDSNHKKMQDEDSTPKEHRCWKCYNLLTTHESQLKDRRIEESEYDTITFFNKGLHEPIYIFCTPCKQFRRTIDHIVTFIMIAYVAYIIFLINYHR